jgi:hypothetical protein
MAGINVTITASAEAAKRALQGFAKQAEGAKRVVDRLFPKGGASSGTALMGRQLQQLTKQTEQYTQRLQVLQGALRQVQQQHQQALAAGASSPMAKNLEAQQKLLERQIRTTQQRMGNLSAMSAAVQSGAVPPGGGGPGGGKAPSAQLPNLNSMLGFIKQGAGTAGFSMGGPLGALAGVAVGVLIEKAVQMGMASIRPAIEHQMQVADLMPRLLGTGNLANADAASRGVRMIGARLGFGAQESLGALGQMSTGGGKFPQLAQDTKSAMQLARHFGLDVGSQAGTLAEAQKMGAFRAGDAKRFASLLAQEIAHAGMGPRAEEVQQATLMLLNTAMRTQASAGPGGLMGLQTLFNKTGIPAFQGTRGASILSGMQEGFQSPGSDRDSALDQAVMRSMGITGYYKQQRFREKAFQDPRLFSGYLNFVHANTQRSPQEDEMETVVGGRFPQLTYSRMEALRKATHGFKDITARSVRAAIAPGGVDVAKGAAAAMDMPGNQWRTITAAMGEAQLRAGIPIVNKLGGIGASIARVAITSAEVADQSKGIKEGIQTLVGLSAMGLLGLGVKAATSPMGQKLTGLLGKAQSLGAGMGSNLLLGAGNLYNGIRGAFGLGGGGAAGEASRKGYMAPPEFMPFIAEAAARTGLDPALIMAVMHHESRFNPRAVSKKGAYGLMQLMPKTAASLGVDARDPRQNIIGGSQYLARQIKRFGSMELGLAAYNAGPGSVMKAGGIPSLNETQSYVPGVMTVYHIIQESGVVSDQSKHAVRKLVRDEIHGANHEHARTHPNRVNRR